MNTTLAGRQDKRVGRAIVRVLLLLVLFSLAGCPLIARLRNSSVLVAAVQGTLGIIFLILPTLLERRFAILIPPIFHGYFYVFLWLSIFLGELVDLYYLFPLWDDALHLTSAFMLSAFFYSLFSLAAARHRGGAVNLMLFLLSFSLSLSVGVLWELFEYFADGAFGLNMQKFLSFTDAGYVALIGRDALSDTMRDLSLDTTGAFASSVLSLLFVLRRGRLPDAISITER